MPVHVKSHRRGKSVVKAYMRAARITSKTAPSRASFFRGKRARDKYAKLIDRKVAIGNILLNRPHRESPAYIHSHAGPLLGILRYNATRKF